MNSGAIAKPDKKRLEEKLNKELNYLSNPKLRKLSEKLSNWLKKDEPKPKEELGDLIEKFMILYQKLYFFSGVDPKKRYDGYKEDVKEYNELKSQLNNYCSKFRIQKFIGV